MKKLYKGRKKEAQTPYLGRKKSLLSDMVEETRLQGSSEQFYSDVYNYLTKGQTPVVNYEDGFKIKGLNDED